MKAHDLIEHLKKLAPDTDVFIWVDGDRLAISEIITVDQWDDKTADINTMGMNDE